MKKLAISIASYTLLGTSICAYLLLISTSLPGQQVSALSINEIIKNSSIAVQESPGIETVFPSRATPNESQDITDLFYWIDTLPYDQDKSAAGYVVYPKIGVTIPLVWPNNDDKEKIEVGDIFDHYKYLEAGALHYVGNAPDQDIGNMVLAVHSSFAKSDAGRYKTAGQVAPLTALGDKIFVYLADEQGKYTLYIYTVQRSEEIPETQVSILDQNVTQKTLTFFTCFPIGTTDARWVNQGVLTETLSAEQRHKPVVITKTTNKTSFTTQSVGITTPKENISTKTKEHDSAPTSGEVIDVSTKKEESSIGIKPTFKERVMYRPVVYHTAMKLVSTVGFKRTNLQKLLDLIDNKIETLNDQEGTSPKNKKLIVIFMLIKELIEGFMG